MVPLIGFQLDLVTRRRIANGAYPACYVDEQIMAYKCHYRVGIIIHRLADQCVMAHERLEWLNGWLGCSRFTHAMHHNLLYTSSMLDTRCST